MPMSRSTRVLTPLVLVFLLALGTALARCDRPAVALQPASVGDLPALGARAEAAAAAQVAHDAQAIAAGIAARAEAARLAEVRRQAEAQRQAAARASRGGGARSSAAPSGGDFWARLAGCESPSNSWSGPYKGYFQFSDTNVRRYGISPSSSYEEQRAAAQRLAHDADPKGQWPTCWRRAGG